MIAEKMVQLIAAPIMQTQSRRVHEAVLRVPLAKKIQIIIVRLLVIKDVGIQAAFIEVLLIQS